jgi:hypothetical protein
MPKDILWRCRRLVIGTGAEGGAIVFKTPLSAGSNAPVAVNGDYVIAGAGAALSRTQRDMIIAYKLGAAGKLPGTVGPSPARRPTRSDHKPAPFPAIRAA